jgi:hypothetical protein
MRIYGQGFTLLAMLAGSYYYREQRAEEKEHDKAVAEQKAKEKNAAWIKELEIRDREDQEVRCSTRPTRPHGQEGCGLTCDS